MITKLSISILLVLLLSALISTVFAEQMGLYDYYSVAPNVWETVVYPEGSKVIKVNREEGYYVDERGQVPEHARIAPPNEDKIPTMPHPSRTVENFEKYYDTNIMGLRRNPVMQQWTPNYNWHYSNRRAQPYTKDEWIDVWCTGDKHLNGVDCQNDKYATTFVPARHWSVGVVKAAIKAKKVGKKAVVFIMIDDLGLDAEDVHNAKEWSKSFNMPMQFGTIDAFIPMDWIP